jgi:GalNAc-alpha-(1->4)-GalNAc-alpha-(1->3)-diNAcBac-PP-undecaprenol alpha-1,4-N-acetyl-D-galactosaminyltransferase
VDKGKRFLTMFPFVGKNGRVLLYKDVGAIPYHLAKDAGWETSLAYVAEEGGERLEDDIHYGNVVRLQAIESNMSQVFTQLRLLKFLARNARQYDVLNMYHGKFMQLMYGLCYKIFNSHGKVYIKLDMNHLSLRDIVESPSVLRRVKTFIKYLLSKNVVDLYTAETTHVVQALEHHYYFRGRVYYIPNGVPRQRLMSTDDLFRCKENIVLTVGRLGAYEKNTEMLLRALTRIAPDLLEDWKVYLVGPIVDIRLKDYIEQIERLYPQLRGRLILTGNISDKEALYNIYKRSKIFCLTSRWEGFPLSLVEAMYFGNYVIASDLPASRDLTKGGAIGSLFPVEDTDMLVEKLTSVLSGSTDLYNLARESHEFISTHFLWDDIVKRLDRLLAM